jgi:hypothetical protein
LSGADLSGCNLKEALLIRAIMTRVLLSDANLSSANLTKKTGFQAPPYASGTATPSRAAFARIQESLHPFIEGCSVQLNVSGLRPSSRGYGIPHHGCARVV